MKKFSLSLLILFLLAVSLSAQTVIKAPNTDALNLGTSWSGGNVPDDTQIALWNTTLGTGNHTVDIGDDLSWFGIQLDSPGTNPNNSNIVINQTDDSTLTLGAGGITLSGTRGSLTIHSNVALAANQVWENNVDGTTRRITVNGILSGSGDLTKRGAGTVALANSANTYTGRTIIEEGTVTVTSLSALGVPDAGNEAIVLGTSTTAGTLISTGGGVDPITNRSIDLQGNGGFTLGGPSGQSATVHVTSSVSGEKTFTVGGGGASGNHTFAGNISDGVAGSMVNVVKTGSREVTLTGTLDFTGYLKLEQGTLNLDRTQAIAGLNKVSKIILSGGSLNLDSGALLNVTRNMEVAGDVNLLGNNYDIKGNITATGSDALTLSFGINSGGIAGNDQTISGIISDGDTSGNILSLVFRQGGNGESGMDQNIRTLTGANTYTGTTSIVRGSVSISTFQNLGNATSDIQLGIDPNTPAVRDWGGLNVTAATDISTARGITIYSTAGKGGRLVSDGAGAVTIGAVTTKGEGENTFILGGTNTGLNTISGAISDNSEDATNTISVRKQDAGTWVLANANTYTGDTFINAGTLILADTGKLTFIIGADGMNNQITRSTGGGNLTLDGAFIFDLSGAGTNVGDSWLIVDIDNLNSVNFGATFAVEGFTSDNAGLWTYNNYQFSELNGTLSVVPEPSSVALLLGASLAAAVWFRRRRCRI